MKLNLFFVFLFFIVTFSCCKKRELYTEDEYYFENNTHDTITVDYCYGYIGEVFNPHDTISVNTKLSPFHKTTIPQLKYSKTYYGFKIHYLYFNIYYKNIKVRFKPDSVPYNYNVNLFEIKNWELTHNEDINEDKYGNKELVRVFVYYTFKFDTINILNQ
jgi:hypothetical protein